MASARYASSIRMFTRFPTENINPILIQERQKARFDTDLITYMLDGGEALTKKRRDMGTCSDYLLFGMVMICKALIFKIVICKII